MKRVRLPAILLVLALLLSLAAPAFAATATTQQQESAQLLYDLGLFRGAGTNADGTPDFALSRAPTRAEAVTMLVRLIGGEKEAQSKSWTIPFKDVAAWAKPYVGYAYAKGLTKGQSATVFGSSDKVSAAQFLTFVLRALGYADGTDFKWNTAWTLSDTVGITDGEYNASTTSFLRGDVAQVCANALSAVRKGSDQTLLAWLLAAGAITGNMVIWDFSPLVFKKNFASILFYPAQGSPGTFTSFRIDKVTVNGLACETLQLTTPADVSSYLASIGQEDTGGFGYIEITYDTAAAQAAATETYRDSAGKTYPLLSFTFTYSALRQDGKKDSDTFTAKYYLP